MNSLADSLEFEWDSGNIDKNRKHKVENSETEEAFFDEKNKVFPDPNHSLSERRFILLGKSKSKRLLFISFTKRINKIRIISARDINKKEVYLYEKTT